MHKMRENTHVILFFLLIMFVASMTIGGLVGGADIMDLLTGRKPDTILKVNGDEVAYEQFSRAYQAELDAYRQKNEAEPQSYQVQQIEDQVVESFIQDILKRQLIDKLGIKVTKEEIKYHIFTEPHPIFTMDQNFWNEKNEFDPTKFQAALSSPGNEMFWQYKEQYLRMLLPLDKLDREVISTVRVTDEDVKQEFLLKNQKAKVNYVLFDANTFNVPNEQIKDADIKSYYQKNIKDYKEEEKRKIRYVLFQTTPTAADSAEIGDFAQSLMDSLKNGSNFARLAETYSEDPGSAVKGGDLGYFGRGAMVKPFEDAVFSTAVGEITGPVKSNFGLHIIKVEDKKKENGEEQVSARHILLKFKASRRTEQTANENANYFSEIAKEEGFLKTAFSDKAKVDTTDYFTQTGFIPGLGMQKRIAMRAFAMKLNEVSRMYTLEDRGYLVFEVFGMKKAGEKPLDEVKTSIISKLRRDRQLEMAKEKAQRFLEKVRSPQDFNLIAAQDSVEAKTTDYFNREGSIPGIGRDMKFIGSSFALETNEISKPVEGRRGYYVIQLIEKQAFEEQTFNLQKESLRAQLFETKRRSVYSAWIANLKEQADIKDYRYMFF